MQPDLDLLQVPPDFQREIRYKCVKNSMELIVLSLLHERPLSGYDIIGIIHDKFRVLLSPGTVYPVLSSLERRGFVQASLSNRKRLLGLTKSGEAFHKAIILENTTFQVNLEPLWHPNVAIVPAQ